MAPNSHAITQSNDSVTWCKWFYKKDIEEHIWGKPPIETLTKQDPRDNQKEIIKQQGTCMSKHVT